jgi:DNA-binding transcriptional LysR family regulator
MGTAGTDAPVDRILLMQTFVRIVEAGSLSGAAAQLGATQPTVSRRLQALEQWFGVRLLQRSTHSMKLTEDGQRCYERAKELLMAWEAFEADLRGVGDEPEGTLRVVAPHAFGQQLLVEPLVRYLQQYPGVSIEWLLQDDTRSMVAEGVDCAIQVGEVSDPSAVAIKLSEVKRIVVAAPGLLATRQFPVEPAALEGLPWLAFSTYYRSEVTLLHSATGQAQRLSIKPRMSTDSLYALRSAALLGLGLAVISVWVVNDDLASGRLVQVLPQWSAPPLPVFLAYRHANFYPARLRRFVEAMKHAMPKVVGHLEAPGDEMASRPE